jgi:hypothetical protein
MTPAPELDIRAQLIKLAGNNPKVHVRDASGETFGFLAPRYPLRIEPGMGVVWHCACTKCGTGTRDLALKYMRQFVRRTTARGIECTLACEACMKLGRPKLPPEQRKPRYIPRPPRRPGDSPPAPDAASEHETSGALQGRPTPEEQARQRRSTRHSLYPERVPTGEFELVVGRKVMARGGKDDDWEKLQVAFGGGELRPVMRRARFYEGPRASMALPNGSTEEANS